MCNAGFEDDSEVLDRRKTSEIGFHDSLAIPGRVSTLYMPICLYETRDRAVRVTYLRFNSLIRSFGKCPASEAYECQQLSRNEDPGEY